LNIILYNPTNSLSILSYKSVFLNPARWSTRPKTRVTGCDWIIGLWPGHWVNLNFFYKSKWHRLDKKKSKNSQWVATRFMTESCWVNRIFNYPYFFINSLGSSPGFVWVLKLWYKSSHQNTQKKKNPSLSQSKK
jgi:hypothetical protein